MFIKKCSSCRYDCKKDKACGRYKRIIQNTAGPPGYRGHSTGLYHLRGHFEAPYHRVLSDTSEQNKWLANDYIRLIKKYWLHDERKGGDLEVMANAIVNTFDSFWNNGDPNHKIDENMSEDERQNIYWKKTLTAYSYAAIDKKNEEARQYNAMITGMPTEVVNDESDDVDAGIKVEKLFKWMKEKLWDAAKDEKVSKEYEKRKVSKRVIPGTTPKQRRKNFEMTLEAMKLHYIDQMGYREIAKLFNVKHPQDLNRMVLRLLPVIAKHQEEIFSEK